MAGKWKIAKAFGEAAAKRAKKGKGIPESVEGAALKHVDFSTNKPFDDIGRAFNEGVNHGNRESWTVRYGSDNGKTAVERFNTEEEARKFYDDHYGADGIDFLEEPALESGAKPRSNQLQKDFDEAFDEAAENHGYKKWREESKDMPLNDGFGGDLHDVNREDAVQRSREEIIKALQQNTDRDVTDVLRDFGYIFEE